MDVLWGARWYLTAVSISVSLKVILSIFSCVLWPSGCLPWRTIHLDLAWFFYWTNRCFLFVCLFVASSWAEWQVCMLEGEFIILNICCKHLLSHFECFLFLSFRVALAVQKLFRWWGVFLKFCFSFNYSNHRFKKNVLWFMSKCVCLYFPQEDESNLPSISSSSNLDFFFCKQLGRE